MSLHNQGIAPYPLADGWIKKRVRAHNGIVFSLKKEGGSDFCDIVDEP